MIDFGAEVRDKITGFTGIVAGIATYISGCSRALVAPKVGEDGSYRDPCWYDIQRLEVINSEAIILDNGDTPGFDKPAPKR